MVQLAAQSEGHLPGQGEGLLPGLEGQGHTQGEDPEPETKGQGQRREDPKVKVLTDSGAVNMATLMLSSSLKGKHFG